MRTEHRYPTEPETVFQKLDDALCGVLVILFNSLAGWSAFQHHWDRAACFAVWSLTARYILVRKETMRVERHRGERPPEPRL